MRHLLAAAGALALAQGVALAQNAPSAQPDASDRLLNRDYITSTGETVPKPGQPQSSGETPAERKIEKRDDKIDRSICSNC
ncbi:hypothetical protein [Methylocella sp.]|uniref:hypothetical protein n=1 Tax=Methylocella sp. TaxID=1978226 RepID=UPI0035B14AEA